MAKIHGFTDVGHARGQSHNQPKHRVPTAYAPGLGAGGRVRPSRTRVLGVMGGRLGATTSGNTRGSKSRGAPNFGGAVMPVQTQPRGASRTTGEQRRGTPARFGSRKLPTTRGFLRRQLPNG